MGNKIVLFGPVASGKSYLLSKARKHYADLENNNFCITVEMDDLFYPHPEEIQESQIKIAIAIITAEVDCDIFMTAGKIPPNEFPKDCKIIRILWSDKKDYMPHVLEQRVEEIKNGILDESKLEEWYDQIAKLPDDGFALTLNYPEDHSSAWEKIITDLESP